MEFLHVSDTHGTFPILPPYQGEFVVHSGDFIPNASRGNRSIEVPFQKQWIQKNAENLKKWLDGRPFLFCYGNHDFTPGICQLLEEFADIEAIDLTSTFTTYKGLTFYGFPFIPYLAGEWNGECYPNQMSREIRALKDQINNGVDILVAHCPPYGILDNNLVTRDYQTGILFEWGQRCGNQQLSDLLSYNLDVLPKWLLCGHIHSHYGVVEEMGIKISNAATKVNVLEI